MTDRIDALLDRMTLDEQAALLAGADFWTTVAIDRLGIPAVKVTDGPNGARGAGGLTDGVPATCFPAAVSLGASWDVEAAAELGRALAAEARSKGAQMLLAPTVNLHRSGLNGRNFECFSEDPHLTSALAVSIVAALQAEGIAATVKHFAANDSEVERQTMSSDVDERTLRELYLAPFEAADGGVEDLDRPRHFQADQRTTNAVGERRLSCGHRARSDPVASRRATAS